MLRGWLVRIKLSDTWYGMTHHEDVAAVKNSFKKMLEKGAYKAELLLILWYTGAMGDCGSYAARNFAHLYVVGGRQHMGMWLRCRGHNDLMVQM